MVGQETVPKEGARMDWTRWVWLILILGILNDGIKELLLLLVRFTYNKAPLKSHGLKKLATSPAQRTSHGNLALIFCMRKKERGRGGQSRY